MSELKWKTTQSVSENQRIDRYWNVVLGVRGKKNPAAFPPNVCLVLFVTLESLRLLFVLSVGISQV